MSRVRHVQELGLAQIAVLQDPIRVAINEAAEALSECDIDVGLVSIRLTAERDPQDAAAMFTIEPSDRGDWAVITFFFPDIGGQEPHEWMLSSFENGADVDRLIRDESSYASAAARDGTHVAVFRVTGRPGLLALEEHNSTWLKAFKMLQHELMVTKPQVEATHGMRITTPFKPLTVRMDA